MCHCEAALTRTYMVLCPKCGNKRCPHAENHKYKCTGSNAVDQIGENECIDWNLDKPTVDELYKYLEMYDAGSLTKAALIVYIDGLYRKGA